MFNDEADPRTEIKSRLNKAARSRYRLKELWSKAKLDHLEKILIYQALIKAKMTYALDVLPIPQAEYDRLDAEYLRGYRQKFGQKTTYGQQSLGEQRTNTNEKVIGLINEALSKTKKQRKFTPISKVIKERAKKKLGDALRRDWKDPVGQVVRGVHSTRARPWNFTLPGECLPWRPKTNWLVDTAKNVWTHLKLHENLPQAQRTYNATEWKPKGKNVGDTKDFLWKDLRHVRILLQAADDSRF